LAITTPLLDQWLALTQVGIETLLLQFQPFRKELRRFAEQFIPRVCEVQRDRADERNIGNSSDDVRQRN
jgi:hypothetical protein